MSDGDALFRAILANPDDDAPRLVYADWLDEHGDPDRATFIRTQIQLARLPADHPDRSGLSKIERLLSRTHRRAWTRWLPLWARAHEFHRGFVEIATCFLAEYLAGAEEVRFRTPLTGVRFAGPGHLAVPLFQSRTLDGLRFLNLRSHSGHPVPGHAWEYLRDCPYLGRLRHLDLTSHWAAGGELIAALLSSTSLPELQILRARACGLRDEDVVRLASHPWIRRLNVLDLSANVIGEEGSRALAESPHLDGLTVLGLRRSGLGVRGHQMLRRRFGDRLRL